MIVDYGDRIEAVCTFDYSGPAGLYTFAQEIGTIIGVGVFNTLDRWEEPNVNVVAGLNQQHIMQFTLAQVSGLDRGTTYDMNFEIGTGSQGNGTWQLMDRVFTDDIMQIAETPELPSFKNLRVTYRKI